MGQALEVFLLCRDQAMNCEYGGNGLHRNVGKIYENTRHIYKT
jgi:hypothetical protein